MKRVKEIWAKGKSFLIAGPAWRMVLANLGLALFLIFFATCTAHVSLKAYTHHGEAIAVPNVRGVHIKQLDKELRSTKLRWVVRDSSKFYPELPPLTVVNQVPDTGEVVKRKRKLYLWVNPSQAQMTVIPEGVEANVLSIARANLENSGIQVGEITFKPTFHTNVIEMSHKGKVIREGDSIRMGKKVDLLVGAGKSDEKVEVPDLVGKTMEWAEVILAERNLSFGAISVTGAESVEDTSQAIILNQEPGFYVGKTIRQGSQINVWISTGIENSPIDPEDPL